MTLSRQELEIALSQLRSEVTRDDTKVQRYQTPIGPAPGVTTVLRQLDKPALLHWAAKMQSEADTSVVNAWLQEPEDERGDVLRRLEAVRQAHQKLSRRAADMGKEGHALAEYDFRKQLGLDAIKPQIEHPQQAYAIHGAIMEWAKLRSFEPVAVEQPVWSRKGYAGTMDWLAYVDGVLTLGDWKSNDRARLYRESDLQNMALRGALREHGIEAAGIVVAVPRDGQGEINPKYLPWDDDTYEAFLGLLKVHRWEERREKDR